VVDGFSRNKKDQNYEESVKKRTLSHAFETTFFMLPSGRFSRRFW